MRVGVVIDRLDGERAARAAYVVRTLLVTLGLRPEEVSPRAGSLAGRVVVWYGRAAADVDAAARVEIPCAEPLTPQEAIDAYRVLTGEEAAVAPEGQDPARVRVGADLVGAAGLWLTGGEERDSGRDAFGRVPGAASPRHQAGLLRTPVVHDLMHVLWAALRRASEAAGLELTRAPAWPEGRRFAVLLSHDVDLWRKRTARQLLKAFARSPWRPGAIARTFCCGPDPWSDLGGIAALEEQRGMGSTFFILAGRPGRTVEGVRVVNGYDAPRDEVAATAHGLTERGAEVALHGSSDSFCSSEALTAERRDVEALAATHVAGCRQHFLRFELPATWRAQAAAGLGYDASLGYHDTDGHRAGFAFPFLPFDGEELPLLELPLTVMDGALLERQGLDADAAWERLEAHLERTEADGAMLGLLWHNTHFCELDAPGYRGIYERALDWIRDHNGWGAPARDIAAWWTRRSAELTQLD